MIFRLYINGPSPNISLLGVDYQKHFIGKAELANWIPPQIEITSGKSKPFKDVLMGRFGAPVVTARFKVHMEDILSTNVEFLPLGILHKRELFVLNVINIINALDHANSEISYLDDEKTRFLRIKSYAFRDALLNFPVIFKIPEDMSSIFVTEAFCEKIVSENITGVGVDDPQKIKLVKGNSPYCGLPT
jgi:hypothetical protein